MENKQEAPQKVAFNDKHFDEEGRKVIQKMDSGGGKGKPPLKMSLTDRKALLRVKQQKLDCHLKDLFRNHNLI